MNQNKTDNGVNKTLPHKFIELRLKLIEYAIHHTLDEFLRYALDEIGGLVNSPIGFFHFVEPDQKTLSLQQWSTLTLQEFCQTDAKGAHYGIDQAGVWVDCVHQKKAVIHNDYASLQHKKGMPQGHAKVIRELVVPVFREDKIVSILGVGNKPTDYTQQDIDLVTFLADVSWEVAQHKKSAEALKISEDRFRRITENAPDMIYRMSLPDGKYEFVSSASERITGYTPEEFYNSSILIKQYIHPEWLDYFTEQWKNLLLGDVPPYYEYQILHKSGEVRWLNQRNVLIKNDSGHPIAIEGAVTDITERKETEENLRHSRELMHYVISHAQAAIAIHDRELKYVYVSDRYLQEYGVKEENVIGKHHYEVFPDLPQKWRDVHQRCLKGEVLSAEEDSYVREDGSVDWTRWACRPWYESDGSIGGIIIYSEVITERKRKEEERLELHKQLQQNAKLKSVGTLAGGIAHDFNNILAALLGNLNLALFDNDLKDSTKKLLSEAEKATLRAKRLTQQLLTLSKGGEPIKETSSLEEVIKDSASFVMHGDKAACHYHIPDNLWLVDIDKGQISQVIQNIVMNACHAMPDGGTVTITCTNISSDDDPSVSILEKGKYVKIIIQDQGIGIPNNLIDKIFDPYFSTKQTGHGLGLAISQAIISKHNGYIRGESTSGKGSTFTIYLPASAEIQAQKPETFVNTKPLPQARILIMDDDEQVRNMLKAMLSRLGHNVTTSENGDEAISLYRKSKQTNNDFDMVIMDLTIPGGMGGERAVKEILNIDPEAKVVVSSGYSNNPIMANFSDHGFCAAIVKPYQLQDLSRTLLQVLD